MKKNIKSTYDQVAEDPKRKENLEKEYQSLLISELILAALHKDKSSVRRLAKEAGVSPTIIQELKSGKRAHVTFATVTKVLDAMGYQILIEPKNH